MADHLLWGRDPSGIRLELCLGALDVERLISQEFIPGSLKSETGSGKFKPNSRAMAKKAVKCFWSSFAFRES